MGLDGVLEYINMIPASIKDRKDRSRNSWPQLKRQQLKLSRSRCPLFSERAGGISGSHPTGWTWSPGFFLNPRTKGDSHDISSNGSSRNRHLRKSKTGRARQNTGLLSPWPPSESRELDADGSSSPSSVYSMTAWGPLALSLRVCCVDNGNIMNGSMDRYVK